jgi:hypothetical protein
MEPMRRNPALHVTSGKTNGFSTTWGLSAKVATKIFMRENWPLNITPIKLVQLATIREIGKVFDLTIIRQHTLWWPNIRQQRVEVVT